MYLARSGGGINCSGGVSLTSLSDFSSCSSQVGPAFEVPTDAFEFQFQPVAFSSHIPHPPVTEAPLPPAKDPFYAAAHRAQ